jgi:hypothetical protein
MYLLMQARPAAARPMNTGSDDEDNENRGGWTGSGSSSKSTTKAPSNIDAYIFLRCNGTLICFLFVLFQLEYSEEMIKQIMVAPVSSLTLRALKIRYFLKVYVAVYGDASELFLPYVMRGIIVFGVCAGWPNRRKAFRSPKIH